VEIKLPAEVVVLARPLRRGDVISAADLTTRMADLARLRGQYYRDSIGLIGQRIKRHVDGNSVLTPSMIDADRLVERGTRVTILSAAGAIEVRVAGTAMGHGGRGDQIRVKNQASGRTITAVVVDQGVVRANP
jgi:flagella basal body P-ring formation protein FlgA